MVIRGEHMSIQCPFCAAVNEAQVNNIDKELNILDKKKIIVCIPVWSCLLCNSAWTDHEAEDIQDRAVVSAIQELA
jgi:transposase-like protein